MTTLSVTRRRNGGALAHGVDVSTTPLQPRAPASAVDAQAARIEESLRGIGRKWAGKRVIVEFRRGVTIAGLALRTGRSAENIEALIRAEMKRPNRRRGEA